MFANQAGGGLKWIKINSVLQAERTTDFRSCMIVCQIHVAFVDFFPSICKTITAFVKKTAQKGNIFDFGAKNCIFNLTFFLNTVRVKLLDYLYLLLLLLQGLLLLLLQGRRELESLLRKALPRSVHGRAKLRQHWERRRGKQAGQRGQVELVRGGRHRIQCKRKGGSIELVSNWEQCRIKSTWSYILC